MYRVPHNPQNQLSWPITLIFFYNAITSIVAAIGGCSLFAVMMYTNRLNGNQPLSLLWPAFFLLVAISRLGFGVGFVKFRSWGYRGLVIVEIFTIISLISRFMFNRERISWVEIALVIIAMPILGYLFRPKIKHQFLRLV